MLVNHQMFADDICVFGRSISGLQWLLIICDYYAAEHEIAFNYKKTIGVRFAHKSINNLFYRNFFWMVYA